MTCQILTQARLSVTQPKEKDYKNIITGLDNIFIRHVEICSLSKESSFKRDVGKQKYYYSAVK